MGSFRISIELDEQYHNIWPGIFEANDLLPHVQLSPQQLIVLPDFESEAIFIQSWY